MRNLLQTIISARFLADVDSVVRAEYGKPSAERLTQRNGYRRWDPGTRVGAVDIAVPKLGAGACFPDLLLERRKRAESAVVTVVADVYPAGVSTRRMDKLVKHRGIDSLSKSQVSRMVEDLDDHVADFRPDLWTSGAAVQAEDHLSAGRKYSRSLHHCGVLERSRRR